MKACPQRGNFWVRFLQILHASFLIHRYIKNVVIYRHERVRNFPWSRKEAVKIQSWVLAHLTRLMNWGWLSSVAISVSAGLVGAQPSGLERPCLLWLFWYVPRATWQGKGEGNRDGCLDRIFFFSKNPPPLICPFMRVQVPWSMLDSEAILRSLGVCTLN